MNRDEFNLVNPNLPNIFVAICYGTDQECKDLNFEWIVQIDYDTTLNNINTLGHHNRLLYIPMNSFDYGQIFEILLMTRKIENLYKNNGF